MNKDKRNNIQLLGTLNNADESGIIANANQIYDANEDKSTQDVSKEHTERIKTLEDKESSMQTTLENITKTGEASAASNVTYNHSDSKLDATNVQQAVDEVRKRSNYNDGDNIIDFNTIHIITDNPEFAIATVDINNRILYGIKADGQPYWGVGVPKVVRDYVDKQVNDILGTDNITETIDSLKEVEKFLSDFKNSDTLKALLDTKANKVDVVFDISAYHATGGTLATYDGLEDALGTNGKNIPQSLRKGGMSVKFVQSSDNKYVQYRLMSDSFGTIENDWQNIGLAQQIGLSETVAMSQKAVTNMISNLINGEVHYNKLLDATSLNFIKGKNIWIGKGYDYVGFDGNLNGLIDDSASWISDFIPNDSVNKEYTLNINSAKFIDSTGIGYIAYIFETDKNSWTDNSVILQTNDTKYSPKNTGGTFSVSKKYFFIVVRAYNFGKYIISVNENYVDINRSNIQISFETIQQGLIAVEKKVDSELTKKFDKSSITQESGEAEDKVMSQKAVSDMVNNNIFSVGVGSQEERFNSLANFFIDTDKKKSFIKKDKKWFSIYDSKVIDFQNPVCQDAPDPTVIKIDDIFYMVSTGRHPMIRTSKDLITWSDYKLLYGDNDTNAPYDTSLYHTYAPQWIKTKDGKIHILVERAGGNNRCYVMTSDNITEDFISDGMLITEEQCTLYGLSYVGDNMILEDQNERFWLYFNTMKDNWNGIHCVELNYVDGKFSLKDTPIFYRCVGGAEGAYCYFKDGYYYLFVSAGAFNSFTYRIEIYRSTIPYGNFVSKNGNKGDEVTSGEAQGTVILYSNSDDYKKSFYGPGHNGEIIIDSNGDYWVVFHSWFKENTVRDMCIMRLKWDNDGYPYFVDDKDEKTTSVQRYQKPPFFEL